MNPENFIEFFRSTAPYIHAHRNKTVVVSIPEASWRHENGQGLVPDLALMNSLGLRLVIVFGSDSQSQLNGPLNRNQLHDILHQQSIMRTELEALLSMGLINSPMHNSQVRCLSGNFIQAKPRGVIDGTDMEFHGQVRSVDQSGMSRALEQGQIVLIPAIGYSNTGEIFSLTLHDATVHSAAAINADKVIFINRLHEYNAPEAIHEMGLSQCTETLKSTDKSASGYADLDAARLACQSGVARCHLIPIEHDGSLLSELFTRDGAGLMVTAEAYDSIRNALIGDVTGIMALLEPLEQQQVLVKRSRELLEQEIDSFFVNERDGMVIGCAALYQLDPESAELSCVAIHPNYRRGGRGERLFQAIVKQAKKQEIRKLYVLTTQTAHWFQEKGFEIVTVDDLPKERQSLYNFQRNSKVFRLTIS